MKTCLNCELEYEPKRPHQKFCSDKCRVYYNRKNTYKQAQSFVEIMNGMIEELKSKGFPGVIPVIDSRLTPVAPVTLPSNVKYPEKDETASLLSYNDLQLAIMNTTSSDELRDVWKLVLANKELAEWQLRYLTRLKDEQRTKFDF